MKGKLSPIIIVALVVVLIAIGYLMFMTLKPSNPKKPNTPQSSDNPNDPDVTSEAVPVLNLTKVAEGEYPSKVIIKVEATPNEENPVEKIVLPDGTTIEETTAEYTVEENGVYSFVAMTVNGDSQTLEMEVTEIAAISANNPYVPEGFTHLEGTTVDNGYTIEDEYGNQYVWIPVESGKVSRGTLLKSNYEETSTPATALVNSVAKYYGFYMGKYEASKYELNGEVAAASMEGKTPWTSVTYQEAADNSEASAVLFGYEDCYTGLISSYAWDTTLEWIDKTVPNFSSSTEYGNYSSSVYATGASVRDIFNNICDLCGNVREWTTEIYIQSNEEKSSSKDANNERHRCVRSGGATLNKTVSSRIGYKESQTAIYWGFRMVLYK